MFVKRTKAGLEEIFCKQTGKLTLLYTSCLRKVTTTHQGPLPFSKLDQKGTKQEASKMMVTELHRQLMS